MEALIQTAGISLVVGLVFGLLIGPLLDKWDGIPCAPLGWHKLAAPLAAIAIICLAALVILK